MATVRAHRGIGNASPPLGHVNMPCRSAGSLMFPFGKTRHATENVNGPANIAVLRRRALDVARHDTSKGSLSIKLKRAGWDDTFLLNLLNRLDTD